LVSARARRALCPMRAGVEVLPLHGAL
jgi:hypothetical protein